MEPRERTVSVRFAIWTAAVVACGVAPWVAGLYLGPERGGGCANAFGAVRALVGGLMFAPAVVSPICLMPAIVGYAVAILRASKSSPDRAIPREAVNGYVHLCGAIIFAVTWETLLFFLYRKASGDGLLALGVGLTGILFLGVLFVWSIVVGLRMARIGKAVRYASAVCIHCGFAVMRNWHLGCPICGGDVCLTGRTVNLDAGESTPMQQYETTELVP